MNAWKVRYTEFCILKSKTQENRYACPRNVIQKLSFYKPAKNSYQHETYISNKATEKQLKLHITRQDHNPNV